MILWGSSSRGKAGFLPTGLDGGLCGSLLVFRVRGASSFSRPMAHNVDP